MQLNGEKWDVELRHLSAFGIQLNGEKWDVELRHLSAFGIQLNGEKWDAELRHLSAFGWVFFLFSFFFLFFRVKSDSRIRFHPHFFAFVYHNQSQVYPQTRNQTTWCYLWCCLYEFPFRFPYSKHKQCFVETVPLGLVTVQLICVNAQPQEKGVSK